MYLTRRRLAVATLASAAVLACHDAPTRQAATGAGASPSLATITVRVPTPTLRVGQMALASAAGTDADGNAIALGALQWSSSSAAVALVDSSGRIVGVAPGQADKIGRAHV